MQHKTNSVVAKAKQRAYDEPHEKFDTNEGKRIVCHQERQSAQAGKEEQQVRVTKDREGSVLTRVQ